MKWVLDASALLAWLLNERGADRLDSVMRALPSDARIHVVNLAEVHYHALRRGASQLDHTKELIAGLGLNVERTTSDALLAQVVQLKATRTPLSLADAFAVGFAMTEGATLLTTDRGEMEKLSDVCSIEFLR